MQSPAGETREHRILMLWERGVGLKRWARDDALLDAIGTRPEGLGARNAALLSLRSAFFGHAWALLSRCPECATECEFETDSASLADALQALHVAEAATAELNGEQVLLRAPTAADLRAISNLKDQDSAARSLLALCVSPARGPESFELPALTELSTQLERLDPGAMVSFALVCPACRHSWSATVDVGEAFWAELQRAAEKILVDIDVLARAYGWTEEDVLGMSATRRAAYLQLAGTP
jgi:hypothetical protein